MISQTDVTLSPTTTTTDPIALNHHHHHHHHHLHPTTTTIHTAKGTKGFTTTKKRKKYDETIIDGFAIIAFKSWEDLQDELNERTSSLNITNTNSSEAPSNFNDTNLTADKKVKTKLKSSSNSSSASSTANSDTVSLLNTSTTTATSTKANSKDGNGHKKKDKVKKSANSHSSSKAHIKDRRNKTTSSEKTTLKKALEAKELAEKRLSILQEKLKQEQSKNRITNNPNNNDNTTNITDNNNSINNSNSTISNSSGNSFNSGTVNNSNIPYDVVNQHPLKTSSIHVTEVHYSSPQTPTTHIIKEEFHQHPRANGILSHDLLKDPNLALKATPYSPYHINSHPHRPSSVSIHQHQHQQQQQQHIHNAPSPPRIPPHINSNYPTPPTQHQLPKHAPTTFLQRTQHSIPSQSLQHQSTPPPPPPQQSTPQSTLIPQSQMAPNQPPHSPYQRAPHPHMIQHHQQSQPQPQPQLNPFSHAPPSSIMSSMGLSSLPSPYSCPPSIYITDTISRQTSIIPPPPQALGHILEQSATSAQANRFGHSNVLHSISPYSPTVPPHHPMYYPTLPTERSFIEFARSYTGPGHLGYPNLMNSFPTPPPTITANPYSFDRWPRMALDQQRAVSRYNSLYQSSATMPDRTFANYTNARPPSFPAGLFPPPF